MLDWESPSSPSARPLFHPYNPNAQWSAGYPVSPQLGQSSFASLQPSTSIWGPQVQKSPLAHTNVTQQIHHDDAPFPLTYGGNINHQMSVYNPSTRYGMNWSENQRRLSSVPSLANSTCSSSWAEESYMVSPPSSPGSSALASSPVSPKISPIGSPQTKSRKVASETQFGSADGDEVEEITISSFCGPLYLVKFKGGRVDIFMAPGTSYYAPGDSVMVDADRGSDLGEVIQANVSRHDAIVFKQKQNKDRTRALSASNIMGNDHQGHGDHAVFVPKQIIGRATPSNIRDMAAKCRDEAAAVAVCNAKVAERGLNMEIVDAEYQWDRRKLTFFYNAGTRVDFRDLVRDLFRIYKTRIWMCATSAR